LELETCNLLKAAFTFAFGASTFGPMPAPGFIGVGPAFVYFACTATTVADIAPFGISAARNHKENYHRNAHKYNKDKT